MGGDESPDDQAAVHYQVFDEGDHAPCRGSPRRVSSCSGSPSSSRGPPAGYRGETVDIMEKQGGQQDFGFSALNDTLDILVHQRREVDGLRKVFLAELVYPVPLKARLAKHE